MKTLVKDIYEWLINPDETSLDLDSQSKMIITFKIVLLDILIAIPVIAISFFIHYYVIKLKEPLIDEGLLLFFTGAVIFAPIFEELIFRLPLKYNRNYLAKFVDRFTNGWIAKRWNSIFKYFLYVMILLFGFIHIPNYDNSETLFFFFSPILVGSQLIGGIGLSYIRIKVGFLWAVLAHSIFNLSVILVLIFANNIELISKSEENLKLKIYELTYIDKDESCYSIEQNGELIHHIEGKSVSLYSLFDTLQLKGNLPYDDTLINIDLESKKGISKSEFIEILKEEITFDE